MRDHAWRITHRERPNRPRSAVWLQTIIARATPDWMLSLSRRVVTAFIAMPIVVAILWFGGWTAFAGCTILLGLGIYELNFMFTKLGYRPLTWLSFLFGVILFIGALNVGLRSTLMEATISLLVLGSLSWLLITRHKHGTGLQDWALTLVMTLYLAWPLSYLLSLRGPEIAYRVTAHGLVAGPGTPHFWWILVVFFGVWAFDSAAFFAGRFFGKHLLAPAISPKKTWEGVVGGVALTIVAVFVFTRPLAQSIAWYHIVALGLLISFAATIGDLAESLIKREADVKDSGAFFWGHGGVLDRIDSLLFAAVIVYFYVTLLLHFA